MRKKNEIRCLGYMGSYSLICFYHWKKFSYCIFISRELLWKHHFYQIFHWGQKVS